MSDSRKYRLEVLSSQDSIAHFTCEDEEINEYIREDALADMARSVARTFVEIDTSKPADNNVAGYFTLRAHALRQQRRTMITPLFHSARRESCRQHLFRS